MSSSHFFVSQKDLIDEYCWWLSCLLLPLIIHCFPWFWKFMVQHYQPMKQFKQEKQFKMALKCYKCAMYIFCLIVTLNMAISEPWQVIAIFQMKISRVSEIELTYLQDKMCKIHWIRLWY